MAAMPRRVPLPPFPQWTGMYATISAPRQQGLTVTADLHIPSITLRARLWIAWRTLTRRGVPDAAAQQ